MSQSSILFDYFLKNWGYTIQTLKATTAHLDGLDLALFWLRVATLHISKDAASFSEINLSNFAILSLQLNLSGAHKGDFRSTFTTSLVANIVHSYCIWATADSQNFRSYSRLSRTGLRTFVFCDTGSIWLSCRLVSVERAVVKHKREAILKTADVSLGLLRRIQEVKATLAATGRVISWVCSIFSNTLAYVHAFTRVCENTAYFATCLTISILEGAWLAQPTLF